MSTELTPIERARGVLQFDETKARLGELAARSVRIVEITGAPGYQEAHRARMDLKTARVDIQKRGKDARADATAFSKAVIAAEGELVEVIEPEENRLQALQEAWDAAREKERQAKIKAEQDRVAAIQVRIGAIRTAPMFFGDQSSEALRRSADDLRALLIGEDFAEFAPAAEAAKAEAIATTEGMIVTAEQREAAEAQRQQEESARAEAMRIEGEKLAAERAELDRLRAEQAERDRIEREAREAEAAKERAETERQRAELRAQQEAAAKAQAEAEAAQRGAQETQRKAEEDAQRAELERQREAERVAREAAEAKSAAARKQAAEAAAARIAAEIASATLREAGEAAVVLLVELGQADHITTRKLAAALAREGGE
jgi:hypothetical protein